ITKAALTVTADDKTRAAGAANPALTATYSGFVGGETLATSGVTGTPTLSATSTNVAGTYPITVTIGTLASGNYSFSFVNGQLTVTPASASKLVFTTSTQTLTATVTSGIMTVQRQDAYNNPNTSDGTIPVNLGSDSSGIYAFRDTTDTSTISSVSIPSVSSSASFKYNDSKAGSPTITAASSGLTSATQLATVNAGAFVKLQLLVPGESAAPGTATGKTGSATARTSGAAFNVTVNAVDANWNVVSVGDTVGLTATDSNATLPANASLLSGSKVFSVTLNTAVSASLTASDITDSNKTSSTSPSLTVNAGVATKLQVLLPGETAAPGTPTGKTGTPLVQTAGAAIANGIVVNAVDANWNVAGPATNNVTITATDSNASVADDNGGTTGNMTLVSGTRALSSL